MSTGIASKKDSGKEGRSDTDRSFRYTCASILIALTMICSAVAVIGFSDSSDAASEGDEDDSEPIKGGTHWAISGDTLTISKTSGSGNIGNYGEGGPDEPRPPWEQGDGWGNVTNVVIESGVKKIGTYAFYHFTGLRSITLPDTLTEISNCAFKDCSNLSTITIPDNVLLKSELFIGCDSLKSIVFKGTINVYGDAYYTFDHTPSLHAVYHTGSGLDLEKWPDQNILFVDTNGGSVKSTANPALPENCKFPSSGTYDQPDIDHPFRAYNINGTYYGAGDYVPEGKVTASIHWGDLPSLPIPVLFDANGHGTVSYDIVTSGTAIPEPSAPSAQGYTFDGWYLDKEGTKLWDFDTVIFRLVTLYAKWTGNVTVNFDMNGHGTPPSPVSVEIGNPIEKPADPTAEGYKFNGWYKERTCQTKWIFTDPVTDSMTLYAEWDVQQCRVSFDMMGHGLGPDPQIVNYGDQVTKPADISIEGYTFGGWFKDISFENEWNFDTDFVKSDTVLYAKWVSNSSGGNDGATVPIWVLTSVIAGSVVFVGAAILLLRRH